MINIIEQQLEMAKQNRVTASHSASGKKFVKEVRVNKAPDYLRHLNGETYVHTIYDQNLDTDITTQVVCTDKKFQLEFTINQTPKNESFAKPETSKAFLTMFIHKGELKTRLSGKANLVILTLQNTEGEAVIGQLDVSKKDKPRMIDFRMNREGTSVWDHFKYLVKRPISNEVRKKNGREKAMGTKAPIVVSKLNSEESITIQQPALGVIS